MKRHLSIILAVCWVVMAVGCGEFTDLKPKGKNMLEQVSDLDNLLNYPYSRGFSFYEVMAFTDDLYPYMTNIPDLTTMTTPSIASVLYTCDETADRGSLTLSDGGFTAIYGVIGKIANPVLLKADEVSGDRMMAARLKAEAYVLRAWFHYVAVNLYAKAYDPATAATTPGVPYVKEGDLLDLATPNKKATVAEVYQFILDDLNAAFELNSLPDQPINRQRVGKAFAYAVQAKALMSMRRFGEAATAAKNSLAVSDYIYDHRENMAPGMMGTPALNRPQLCEEDLFFTYSYVSLFAFTEKMLNTFEDGYLLKIAFNMEMDMGLGGSMYGLPNIKPYLLGLTNTFFSSCGLTTVDMYLTQAECFLREGKIEEAMGELDKVRERRISADVYAPLKGNVTTPQEGFAHLKQLATEENLFTCKNFIDRKRWNTEEAYRENIEKALTYTAGTETVTKKYTLTYDSPLWIFAFPQNATMYNSNLTQNY